MTRTASLEKARVAKRASDVKRREQHAKDQAQYCLWVQEESQAFSKRAHIIEMFGRNSEQFRAADLIWHELLKLMPTPPPDHAWS